MTVRSSMGEIVQFTFGGDSLDPVDMEGKDKPVDFKVWIDFVTIVWMRNGNIVKPGKMVYNIMVNTIFPGVT